MSALFPWGGERDSYLNILRFLNESSDDYFFLWEFQSDRLYFSGSIARRYDLPLGPEGWCAVADWCAIVYDKDLPALAEELDKVRRGILPDHNMEYRLLDREGNRVWINCRGKSQLGADGAPLLMVGRVSDSALVRKADPLTGAFNALKLTEDMDALIAGGAPHYLLLLGVDNLKAINIKHGRPHGNRLLKLVAETLEDVTDMARVYRLGGDCFAVNLPTGSREEVEEVYRQVRERLADHCTVSAGAVSYQECLSGDGGALFQYAEEALDKAKRTGKDTLAFFSAADYERTLSTLELQEELQRSVQNGFGGFSLHYQPQLRLGHHQIFGAEALLRYTSPTRGAVSPAEFIPVLEQTGLICPVGLWVLESALAQCRAWRSRLPEFHISVNISYAQLAKEGVTQAVLEVLERSGLPGDALTLEVTESMQLQDYPHFNKIFYQWKKYGVEISVDDFGTGYSSLGHLKSMEVDEIKIDRCFVSGIQHSAYNYRLLSNMIELARSSQIRVCCEGVETAEELSTLEELHPDLLQGYLFARPCPPEEFASLYLQPRRPEFQAPLAPKGAPGRRNGDRGQDSPVPAARDELDTIIGALDEIIYVSDPATYELYYLNPAGRRLTGVYDYKGRKCYKVLQGRDDPCDFCTNHCLKPECFYAWEWENPYLNRHFLLKDKLILWRGKPARLEYAMDVTDQELVSQAVQEKLDFAQNVVSCAQSLAAEPEMERAIQQMLSSVGEFYQADRAYLFQPDTARGEHWSNTYEWCRNGVSPERDNLQSLPEALLRRWMEFFSQGASVVIPNVDAIQSTSPREWQDLSAQGIRRLIACPIRVDGQLLAFIGVDNPRHCVTDDAQMRTMTLFIASRFQRNAAEERLGELLDLGYRDILRATEVGLWFIRLHKDGTPNEMFADENMKHILGLGRDATPQECYQHWYSRINDGYYHYVNLSVEHMLQGDQVVQLQYTWNHPTMGEVLVRCTGVRARAAGDADCLEGYHRIVSNMAQPRFLPDTPSSEMFEFNERKGTIYFHTQRHFLFGDAQREDGFPRCWVDSGMVHPHFAQRFQETFRQVGTRANEDGWELLLRSPVGEYTWFRLKTRHLGRDAQDQDTILVLLDPANQQRLLELENLRLRDFYHASLSEAVAYAEVDLESGQLQAAGGLWEEFMTRDWQEEGSFLAFLSRQVRQTGQLPEEAPGDLWLFQDQVDWPAVFRRGERTQRFTYCRSFGAERRWVELVMHVFQEQFTETMYALVYLMDIDVAKRRELAQKEAADRDPLTGVYNRNAFEAAAQAFMSGGPEPRRGALILLDIDNFKDINDRFGHPAGDAALKRLTGLLKSTFRSRDIIGRLGGDEFMVFLKGPIRRDILDQRMDALLAALWADREMPLSCSAGVCFAQGENFSYTDCLLRADMALYRSKQVGKSRYCYAPEGQSSAHL